jgi:hypothetical protein
MKWLMSSQELGHSPTSSQLPTKLNYPQTNVIHWKQPELPGTPGRGSAVNNGEPRDFHLPISTLLPLSFQCSLMRISEDSHNSRSRSGLSQLQSIQLSIVNSPLQWSTRLRIYLNQRKERLTAGHITRIPSSSSTEQMQSKTTSHLSPQKASLTTFVKWNLQDRVGGIHCSLYPRLTFLQIERKISCSQIGDVALLATAAHSMQAQGCQNRVRR